LSDCARPGCRRNDRRPSSLGTLCLPKLDVRPRSPAFPGINRIYLSKLEKGASYPGLEIIAKLATVLEVEAAGVLRMIHNG
jgi:hypothetical protein